MKMSEAGFTMQELIITLAIAAILVAVGAPALEDYIITQRIITRTNGLVVSLNFARAEAVTRGNNEGINILAREDDQGNNNWNEGWWIWEDGRAIGCNTNVADDNARSPQGCEDLRENSFEDQVTMTPDPITVTQLNYRANGMTGQAVRFDICHPKRQLGRTIQVTLTGRVSTDVKEDCPTS
jgi:type IV fimbrial biogenesis protein FimT